MKKKLFRQLKQATDRAAHLTVENQVDVVGDLQIKKERNGLYSILKNSQVLHKDITMLAFARILASRLIQKNDTATVEKLIALEAAYSKFATDLVHYIYCKSIANLKKEYSRQYVLEDKIAFAKEKLGILKKEILMLQVKEYPVSFDMILHD